MYVKTTWEDLPSTNTPLSASNLNKIENELEYLDSRIKPVIANSIWSGSLYEINSSITLTEDLVQGQVYIFTIKGLSDFYNLDVPFIYNNSYFQYSYNDGTAYFRMRLRISNNRTITVDSASTNMASNTALINIQKLQA